jgi:hypothetical protein
VQELCIYGYKPTLIYGCFLLAADTYFSEPCYYALEQRAYELAVCLRAQCLCDVQHCMHSMLLLVCAQDICADMLVSNDMLHVQDDVTM